MIETRRGQPMRLVGPGNFSGEARVSLNDPQSPASCGLLGPFAPTLRPSQYVLLANRTYWHRSKCAPEPGPMPIARGGLPWVRSHGAAAYSILPPQPSPLSSAVSLYPEVSRARPS